MRTAEEKSGADELRQRILRAGHAWHREHELLVQVEDALEVSARSLLTTGALPAVSEIGTLRAALAAS